MKPRRSGHNLWFGRLIVVCLSLTFLSSGLIWAAPPAGTSRKEKAAPQPKPAQGTPNPANVPAPAGKKAAPTEGTISPGFFADAHPGGPRQSPADLGLKDDGRRKAEALAFFAQGITAEDNADMDAALVAYLKALALDPSYSELAVKAAYELTRRNNVSAAVNVLKDTAKASPKDPLPLIYLSQLYSKHLKKPDLALKFAEQAVSAAPEHFPGYLAVYELHSAANQAKKAVEILERAGRSKSADPKFWTQLGDLHTRRSLKEDGSSLSADLERMNTIFRHAAELGKTDAVTQAKVGDYFVLSRQVREAIPFYLTALKHRAGIDDPTLQNLRDKLARAFLVTQQRDQAIDMLEAVVREQPMRFETHELLGELYQQKGDTEKAIANFEQTLQIDSSRPESYLRLADLYLKLKRPDKAVDTVRMARGKFPDVPQIAFSLAVTLSQAKRHTEAMTAFAEAQTAAEQSHEDMLNASFYFQYGAAAEQAGLIDKAAELMRESIRLDPSNAAQAQNYLGYMWVDRDINLDEAGGLIRKALEQDPDNGAYLDSLGWYHFKKGEYEKAQKELLRALENLKDEDPVVFDHLGDTYQALGKPAEALSYWQKSLAVEDAPKVREKVESAKQKVTQSQPSRAAPPAPASENK
jgi:tetratricopeptide (TPR) repeat protein